MARGAQGRATQRATGTPASRPERKPRDLKVAEAPATARRSITDVGTLLALGMFAVCLALAALHAVLVENQATLDDLIEHNQQSRELIDQLQAEIAFLDSPEGLAEHAHSVGLVPAAELALLTPVGPDLLQPLSPTPSASSHRASSGQRPSMQPLVAATPRPSEAEWERGLIGSLSRRSVVLPALVRCAHGPLGPRPRFTGAGV